MRPRPQFALDMVGGWWRSMTPRATSRLMKSTGSAERGKARCRKNRGEEGAHGCTDTVLDGPRTDLMESQAHSMRMLVLRGRQEWKGSRLPRPQHQQILQSHRRVGGEEGGPKGGGWERATP